MKFLIGSGFFAVTLLVSSLAHSVDVRVGSSFEAMSADQVKKMSDATNLSADIIMQNEASQTQIDKAVAPIKSARDLQFHILNSPMGSSPLDSLSPRSKQIFLSSLTFNEKGLTGFQYDVLETLTPTQIYKILSLFGEQRFTSQMKGVRSITAADSLIMSVTPMLAPLMGYRCEARGTCSEMMSKACTDNC
jgi:hypothetical protein